MVNLSLQAVPSGSKDELSGGRFNRVLTTADWRQLKDDIPYDICRALRDLLIIEGETVVDDTGSEIQGRSDQLRTMFLHMDGTHRIMSTPVGGRPNGTWFIHPDDYVIAQHVGLEYLLASGQGKLSSQNLNRIAYLRDNLGLSVMNMNIPIDSNIVSDAGLDVNLLKGYQAAILNTPGIRTRRVSWEQLRGGPTTIRLVRPHVPHFQEIQNGAQFILGGTVRRVDARIDA